MSKKEVWEAAHKAIKVISTSSLDFLAFMAAHYWEKADLTFLDIGCGSGACTHFIAKKGFKVIAVDISTTACDSLLEMLSDNTRSLVEVVNLDTMDLDFGIQSFDCIVFSNVLECLELEQAKVLFEKIRGWLRPNGRVYIRTLMQVPLGHEISSSSNLKIYSLEELISILVGFSGTISPVTRYVRENCIPIHNWVIDVSMEYEINELDVSNNTFFLVKTKDSIQEKE